jgi:hypothetical protein
VPLPAFVSAVVGAGSPPSSLGPTLQTGALATATGGYLFVTAAHYTSGVSVSAVTDTVGNTFVRAGTVQGGDASDHQETWFTPAPIVGTASSVVTLAYTGNAQYRYAIQALFSWGSITSVTYDTEATIAIQSASAKATNTLSVADNGLLIGAFGMWDGIPSPLSSGTGTILLGTPNTASCEFAMAYRLFTSSAAAATLSIIGPSANAWSVTVKAFRGVGGSSSAAAASPLRTITLINAGT